MLEQVKIQVFMMHVPLFGMIPWGKKWQPTPVFLSGEFCGQRSLVGNSPWGSQIVRQDWRTNTFTVARKEPPRASEHRLTCQTNEPSLGTLRGRAGNLGKKQSGREGGRGAPREEEDGEPPRREARRGDLDPDWTTWPRLTPKGKRCYTEVPEKKTRCSTKPQRLWEKILISY